MSCEGNRRTFLRHIVANIGQYVPHLPDSPFLALLGGDEHAALGTLEKVYQRGKARYLAHKDFYDRHPDESAVAKASTLLLFGMMRKINLKPPTHSASGLPRVSSQFGYRAVKEVLTSAVSGSFSVWDDLLTFRQGYRPDHYSEAEQVLKYLSGMLERWKPPYGTDLRAWRAYSSAYSRRERKGVLEFFDADGEGSKFTFRGQGNVSVHYCGLGKTGWQFEVEMKYPGGESMRVQIVSDSDYGRGLFVAMAAAKVLTFPESERLMYLAALKDAAAASVQEDDEDQKGWFRVLAEDTARVWVSEYSIRLAKATGMIDDPSATCPFWEGPHYFPNNHIWDWEYNPGKS
ncbi:hypothetical protein D6833_13345 [Candidatus Parcubacteria bacterium]|nr:MAG: hypothetical protein D6833_13345 [Candidatus Parcubacteria bacterium]